MTSSSGPGQPESKGSDRAAPNPPIHWERPGDERAHWVLDSMHFTEPVSVACAAVITTAFAAGFNHAAVRYALPVRARFQRLNGYIYQAIFPQAAGVDEAGEGGPDIGDSERHAGSSAARYPFAPVLAELDRHWFQEWLPEVRGIVDRLHAFDLASATMPELIEQLEVTVRGVARLSEIHFLASFPAMHAGSQFSDVYQQLFDDAGPFDALRLVEGLPNRTVEANDALWRLSRRLRALPDARRAVEAGGERAIAALSESVDGRTFLPELHAYLAEFGERSDSADCISHPGWVEDPAVVLSILCEYLMQSDRDLDAERAGQTAERERAIAAARQRLAERPVAVRDEFEALLRAAGVAQIIHEDHNYWIDQRGFYQVRRILLEFGRRFTAATVLDRAEEIVHLTLDEVRVTAASLPRLDRRALVRERLAELEQFAAATPPAMLGTTSPGPIPNNPLGGGLAKFFGTPAEEIHEPRELRGNAGSAGVTTGTAKIILSLSDAGRLQLGDILVTQALGPAWTPLFATAGAVVTDTGGILSHGAVVAREYGIPAVVGTQRATQCLRDGQILEVDGSRGVVRIVSASE